MQEGRTKNTTRNIGWGFFEKIIQTILPMVTRTLIVHLIGEKYMGLSSLFTSIISVLNLADLGFGVAITYTMYKPIAEHDDEKLCAILNYYKKVYRIIGLVVCVIGLAIMPFLSYLINDEVPADVNIYLLFGIYLTNTVLSYWLFAYKKSLLQAYQRNDIKTKISTALLICQYGLQILVLLAWDNYYAYVIVLPLITLLGNICTAIVTQKMYPNVLCRGVIPKEATKGIKKQVGGAFIGRVCSVTRNSLDSLFISATMSLTAVTIYSNYYMILSAVHNMLNVFTTSMVGGVGNSIAKESEEKNYRDFGKFTFLYSWISGWCACCMLCLYQHFMNIWMGEALMLPFGTMVLFCIYLYVMSASDIKNVYYSARGLWWEGKWRSIIELILNVILNLVGVYFFGVFGIVLATIITMVLVNFLYGAKILFKNYFKNQSMKRYLLKQLAYLCVVASVSALTYLVCALLPSEGILFLLVKAAICLVLPNLLFYIAYCKTKSFAEIKPFIGRLCSGLIGKLRRKKHRSDI